MGEVWHTGGRKVSPMVQTRNWSSSGDASIFRDGDDNSTIGKHNRPTFPSFEKRTMVLISIVYYFCSILWELAGYHLSSKITVDQGTVHCYGKDTR